MSDVKTKLENGQKLNRQFRNVSFDVKSASMDDGSRTVRGVSVSSDEPYERWYGSEILLHDKSNVDLERVDQNAAPLLFNHDRDAFLGKISNPQLKDGKLYVDFKFSGSPQATQVLSDLKEGLLTECSIGYDVSKYEVDEDEETYTATAWKIYEASLVTIPADATVGVGRSALDGESRTVEIHVKEKIETEPKKDLTSTLKPENTRITEKHMSEQAEAVVTAPTRKDLTAAEERATASERKRVKDIQDLSEHFRKKGLGGRKIDTAGLAQTHIQEGKTVQEFKDACMTGTFEEIETLVTDDDGENRASGIKVIGERTGKGRDARSMSIGEAFIRSKDFQAKARLTGTERSVTVDYDHGILGIRGKVAMAQRAAGFNSADLSAVNVQIQSQVVGLGMQRLTVMDLLTGGATDAAAIIYPRENSYGTVDGAAPTAGTGGTPGMPRAKAVGERGLKPNWDPDLTSATANVKKIAITTKVPDEFMADFPAAQSYIDGRLPFMVDTETEFQLLYGSGVGNDLLGIYTTQGVQTRAIDTSSDSTVAASLKKGLTDIEVQSFFEPDGYVFHPYDWETATLLKDTNGRFLAGGPYYIPYTNGVFMELNTFWGKPVVKTTAATYGKPLAGCFKLGAQYFMREGMRLQMTNSNEDDFKRNMIAIRAEHRLALATYRPVSFLEFTGMPART